jgi:spermidine synthase
MKQPAWKRFLSYFYTFCLEDTHSNINPHLQVFLKQGRYQLCTDHAVYSYGDLYDNFTRAFDVLKLEEIDVRKVLVLGFGMGSIPIILEKLFEKDYEYTGIEIDKKVIELAHKYVLPEVKSKINLVCADAYQFVMGCKEKFDLIAVDVFLDDMIPASFEKDDFLARLATLLSPEGIVVYNRLSQNKKDIALNDAFYNDHFKNCFPDADILIMEGNSMLLSRRDFMR